MDGTKTEVCDGASNSCGQRPVDEGCDDDRDGWCDAGLVFLINPFTDRLCPQGPGDCNDNESNTWPGAPEICDGLDNSCEQRPVDEGCNDDGDDWCDTDLRFVENEATDLLCPAGRGDCDDTNQQRYPQAPEICDGVDNSCDARPIDGGCNDDGDDWCDANLGWVDSEVTRALCSGGTGDCDDNDLRRYPDAPEICDGLDNSCRARGVDEGCNDDDDGWCDAELLFVENEATNLLCSDGHGDCDDGNPARYPGADEVCDGMDNSCDARDIDDGCNDDQDDWCDAGLEFVENEATRELCSRGTGDCDDNDPDRYPDAEEICDGHDNSCQTREVDSGCDEDNDEYCNIRLGFVDNEQTRDLCENGSGDCNDADPLISPGATESCDGVDNNCNGQDDDGCNEDGDSYCNAILGFVDNAATQILCPDGHGDCDDERSDVNPAATEICDGIDNNCDDDRLVDEDDPDYDHLCPLQDGPCQGLLSECIGGEPQLCDYAAYSEDFEDEPGFGEISCDGIDNDCDGEADEACGSDCPVAILSPSQFENRTINIAAARSEDGLVAFAFVEGSDTGLLRYGTYDPAMQSVRGTIRIAETSLAREPALAFLSDGQFVLVYLRRLSDSRTQLRALVFRSGEQATEPEIWAATFGGRLHAPSIHVVDGRITAGALYEANQQQAGVFCTGNSFDTVTCSPFTPQPQWTDREVPVGRVQVADWSGDTIAVYPHGNQRTLPFERYDGASLLQRLPVEFRDANDRNVAPLHNIFASDESIDVYFISNHQDQLAINRLTWIPGTFLVDLVDATNVEIVPQSLLVARDQHGDLMVWHNDDTLYHSTEQFIASFDPPKGHAPFAMPSELADVNTVLLGRGTGGQPALDVLFINRQGQRLCPEQ
jgi:hypothetical protein